MRTFSWIGIAAGALLLASCRADPRPVGVRGTVSLDGQPLLEGFIEFEPVDGKLGQMRRTAIRNGTFELPAEQGLLPAIEFKVIVKAFRKTGKKYLGALPGMNEEVVQVLPARYNAASSLRATPSIRTTENVFAFELHTQPDP